MDAAASEPDSRLEEAMQICASVRSSHVVQFLCFCFSPRPQMVMEFMQAGSVFRALQDDRHCDDGVSLFSWYKRCVSAANRMGLVD